MLMANSTAILTDAFPPHERGMALGINQVAALAGSFIGLVVGGLLAEWNWRAVFLVSVPIGIAGTIWSYRSLQETAVTQRVADRLVGQHHVRRRADRAAGRASRTGSSRTGGGPRAGPTRWVLAGLIGGVAAAGRVRASIETRVADADVPPRPVPDPRVRGRQHRRRCCPSIARGGMQFMLIIWLQGIWLPLHGYDFEQTPLWAGIYLLPLTVGFLVAGPLSGRLSDRHGARLLSTGGLLLVAATFLGLLLLPVDFPYWAFAAADRAQRRSARACSPRRTPPRS